MVVCGLWFVVCGLWFVVFFQESWWYVVCGLWFFPGVLVVCGLWFVVLLPQTTHHQDFWKKPQTTNHKPHTIKTSGKNHKPQTTYRTPHTTHHHASRKRESEACSCFMSHEPHIEVFGVKRPLITLVHWQACTSDQKALLPKSKCMQR